MYLWLADALSIVKIMKKRYVSKEAYEFLQMQVDDGKVQASEIDPNYVIGYQKIYNKVIKRAIDIVLSLVLLLLIWPIMAVAAIAIVIEDGFPIFYKAKRGGYKGKTFYIYKFRSMVKNADKIGGGTTALHDRRITKVGNVMRKTKIDEFPNVINVLKGDMSFIGPRPELLTYTSLYDGTEKLILEVRPGMTDYSSIEYINLDEIVGSGDADVVYETRVLPKKNKLRVKYAGTVSLKTDVRLFWMTIMKVLEKAYAFIVKKDHR